MFECYDKYNDELFAVKRIRLKNVSKTRLESLEKEVSLLKNLDHENIVKYIDTFKTQDHLFILLEYMETGSLAKHISLFGAFKEDKVQKYIKQVLIGLEYLHKQGVVHRDVKGANILLARTGAVKLADFGVAGLTGAPASSEKGSDATAQGERVGKVVGTPYWMAPEVISMSLTHPTPASDIWSLGCTIVEMLTGHPPFFSLPPMTAMYKIVQLENEDFELAEEEREMDVDEEKKAVETDEENEGEQVRACGHAILSTLCATVDAKDIQLQLPGGDFLRKCFETDHDMRETSTSLLTHEWLVSVQSKPDERSSEKSREESLCENQYTEVKPDISIDTQDIKGSYSMSKQDNGSRREIHSMRTAMSRNSLFEPEAAGTRRFYKLKRNHTQGPQHQARVSGFDLDIPTKDLEQSTASTTSTEPQDEVRSAEASVELLGEGLVTKLVLEQSERFKLVESCLIRFSVAVTESCKAQLVLQSLKLIVEICKELNQLSQSVYVSLADKQLEALPLDYYCITTFFFKMIILGKQTGLGVSDRQVVYRLLQRFPYFRNQVLQLGLLASVYDVITDVEVTQEAIQKKQDLFREVVRFLHICSMKPFTKFFLAEGLNDVFRIYSAMCRKQLLLSHPQKVTKAQLESNEQVLTKKMVGGLLNSILHYLDVTLATKDDSKSSLFLHLEPSKFLFMLFSSGLLRTLYAGLVPDTCLLTEQDRLRVLQVTLKAFEIFSAEEVVLFIGAHSTTLISRLDQLLMTETSAFGKKTVSANTISLVEQALHLLQKMSAHVHLQLPGIATTATKIINLCDTLTSVFAVLLQKATKPTAERMVFSCMEVVLDIFSSLVANNATLAESCVQLDILRCCQQLVGMSTSKKVVSERYHQIIPYVLRFYTVLSDNLENKVVRQKFTQHQLSILKLLHVHTNTAKQTRSLEDERYVLPVLDNLYRHIPQSKLKHKATKQTASVLSCLISKLSKDNLSTSSTRICHATILKSVCNLMKVSRKIGLELSKNDALVNTLVLYTRNLTTEVHADIIDTQRKEELHYQVQLSVVVLLLLCKHSRSAKKFATKYEISSIVEPVKEILAVKRCHQTRQTKSHKKSYSMREEEIGKLLKVWI